MAIKLEDVVKCEKCGIAGELIWVRRNHTHEKGEWWDLCEYQCTTKLCLWFERTWLVQSNKDGYVYERDMGTRGFDKAYEPLSPSQLAYGRQIVENAINEELE